MSRLLKTLILLLVVGTTLVASLWWLAARSTYRDKTPPSQERIRQSFQASAQWLVQHEAEIIQDGNAMLWRMVREAAIVSGDPGLQSLSQRYRSQWVDALPSNGWAKLFDPVIERPSAQIDLGPLRDYQRLFVYALSCDSTLGARPEIQRQLTAQACYPLWKKIVHGDAPCVTHQLMGFMLMREARCGDPRLINQSVALSHERIQRELAFDFRVTDAYLQRVMMLYRTGASSKVKPVWLNNVLSAQQADGAWGPYFQIPWISRHGQPIYWNGLANLLNEDSEKISGIGNFHATAQGVLLTALAMSDQPDHQAQILGWVP